MASSRRCAFCNREIEHDAPPEHVLPQWLSKFRPKGGRFVHLHQPETRGEVEYPPTVPNFRSKRFEITANTVCRKCNHGWMSDLETWCSPLLTPMILGQRRGLTIEQQTLLSQWIVKTVLTWDQSRRPEARTYPVSLCQSLWKHRLPPAGTMVRMGNYGGEEGDEFVWMASHALFLPGVPLDHVPAVGMEALRTTIRIGHLVMEVIVVMGDEDDPSAILEVRGGDPRDILLTIWPSVEVGSWPPRARFDAASLASFTQPQKAPKP
jgi:hypothetical protein